MTEHVENLEIDPTETFDYKKARYFEAFALAHWPEMRKLQEGKVLGPESKGWRNIAEHNLAAGAMAFLIGRMVGLPEEDLIELTSVAATHDWDKRLEREAMKRKAVEKEGITVITDYDTKQEIEKEIGKTGLARVTGDNWLDYDEWGLKEKILRFVDSSLKPVGIEGEHTDFVEWKERITELEKRRPSDAQIETGRKLYYGTPVYTILRELMGYIEEDLYDTIIVNNPDLKEKYDNKNMLTQLISDQLTKEIESFGSASKEQ